ncbi:MAG: AAA family ATPase [Thaumarchaeota archaeon]|nr:AAA family ATPase [Nitrososphaerota archaeon]
MTGTPGTGKKTIAPMTAKALGLRLVSIDELARDHGLLDGSHGDDEVDVHKLKRKLEVGLNGPALVYGHLLPQAFRPDSMTKVVVLRCEPTILKKRLEARGYGRNKVIANVEAELIGLVSSEAFAVFGDMRTLEVDTSKTSPGEAARLVATAIREGSSQEKRIDWTLSYGSAPKLRSLLSIGTE